MQCLACHHHKAAWRSLSLFIGSRLQFQLPQHPKFIAFILPEVRALQPALCLPPGVSSHRICHHLRRTKSHTSCLRHQSSQNMSRFTCIPVQEVGRDLTFRMYSQYWYLPRASRQKKSYHQQFHTVHIQTYIQSPPGLISEELTWC